jgi:protein-tyrosine phosphatase
VSTRLYGPLPRLEGFSWIADERVAIGSIPLGDAVSRLPELGVTHVVNCRATLQTRISQDLWAERRVFGADRVAHAPMWDHGRAQPPRIWAPAAEFAARALEKDPAAGVLIHCQQGRRRSAMVAYAVLRLRGHEPSHAARLVLDSRLPARIVPAYRESVERWLSQRDGPLP